MSKKSFYEMADELSVEMDALRAKYGRAITMTEAERRTERVRLLTCGAAEAAAAMASLRDSILQFGETVGDVFRGMGQQMVEGWVQAFNLETRRHDLVSPFVNRMPRWMFSAWVRFVYWLPERWLPRRKRP